MASIQADASFDVETARKHFPSLRGEQVFFDNAGGTQVLNEVIESIHRYLIQSNVQLGATYFTGKLSTQLYNQSLQDAAGYINADPDEIVLGPSTTQLFRNLSIALRHHFPADSEIIVSALDHEANIASWVTLASDLNLTLKWWHGDSTATSNKNPQLTPDSLKPLLTSQTCLVTCTHASNVLGTITPIRAIADLIHDTTPHGLLCVDGVALAPHRPVDVQALGVDIYAFSWYKVFGPHIAQLFVRRGVQKQSMRSLGHYFKSGETLEDKLGLAGAAYELVQGVPHVVRYLKGIEWEGMVRHEERLQEELLKYLRGRPEAFEICGSPEADAATRVPVVSFVVKGRASRDVVEAVEGKSDFGFRWGHFYSKRLTDEVLKLGEDGVVRVSMVHYNSLEEIQRFVEDLNKAVVEV
ncbi:MAG: hypothetical protein M1831_006404 [Alyxoria varia]|nr:MAG: hypothetical protein M1831_006404 [Alyxoria varia]